jgi:iron complex transport system permease protein
VLIINFSASEFHYRSFLGGLTALIAVAAFVALLSGSSSTGLHSFIQWLQGEAQASHHATILFELRLPRILLALFSGALLAVSGAAMQGLFKNPLADPSLIGVTAGASLGGASIIFFSIQLNFFHSFFSPTLLVAIGACIGAALCVGFVYRMARSSRGTSVATMLLAGIAITAFAGALNSLFEFFSDDQTLRRLSLWRMGSLDSANMVKTLIALTALVFSYIVLHRQRFALNAFLLGESEARHLGINVHRSQTIIVLCVAFSIGISVALTGAIAFVGLVVPHAMRLLVGPNHRFLLPAAALGGALLLVVADTLARTLFAPAELPTGLITALAGAPFFISLLRSRFNFGI